MASKKNVPASTVRAWFAGLSENDREGIPAPGSRGRLSAETVKAFHKANPRMRYAAGEASAPTVTVKVTRQDKKGRNYSREVTVTTREAREALGHPADKRGRIPMAALSEALSATK